MSLLICLQSILGMVINNLVVVNRILFRFGFGRKFRPKHVSVSAFRLSPLSVIRPKQVFRPKEAVSAKITVSAKIGCLVNIMELTLLFM